MENGIKITMSYETDYPNQPKRKIVLSSDAVVLDDILRDIEDFLRGSGFVFDGYLDIVNEDD